MLGVPQGATEDEIKKSYKKLALQVHPDKNRAPGATEAFKGSRPKLEKFIFNSSILLYCFVYK